MRLNTFKHQKFWHSTVAFIYFFVNALFLPFGMLYTHLMSPFFFVYLLIKKRGVVLFPLLIFLVPFDLIHLYNGVTPSSFIISNALLISTYIVAKMFAYSITRFLNLRLIFKQILIVNFIAALCCIPFLFTPWIEAVWYLEKFTNNVSGLPRLDMFTYEASYYSLMFAPIAIYYIVKLLFGQSNMRPLPILILVLVPLGMSLSIGVIGAMLIAFTVLLIMHWKEIFRRKSVFLFVLSTVIISLLTMLLLLIIFPENAISMRVSNILNGTDSSGLSRTVFSSDVAWLVAKHGSIWFGSGLGQIKEVMPEIAREYYNYYSDDLGVVRIPNTLAETLAIFGIFGLIIRFAVIFYFFYRGRVLKNYFQTTLFIFLFVYQFTGSFIVNIVEYVGWVLAFTPVFDQFNVPEQDLHGKL